MGLRIGKPRRVRSHNNSTTMSNDFNPIGDPLSFFLWDEFIDPGKPYQCPECGRLLDDDTSKWNDDRQCHVIECPDCHALVRVDSREHGP